MSDSQGVSESGSSGGGGEDHSDGGVSEETKSSVEDAMSEASDDANQGPAENGAVGDSPINEITPDEARATQERMEAEGKAARESFERRDAARKEAELAAEAVAPVQTYADALDQEVAALNQVAEVEALEPTLREQMIGAIEGPVAEYQVEDIDAFLESDAGISAAEQYAFDHALETSNLSDAQKIEAMGHFTADREIIFDENGQITLDEYGNVATEPVLLADAGGGLPTGAVEGRTTAEIAADYAAGLNETVAAVAESRWAWAAGIAFDAVALAAGGPVRFAVTEVAGAAAAGLLEQGLEAGVEYLAEETGLEPEDVANLAIAGATILGGAVLGWQGVKATVRNLPEKITDIGATVRRFRDDESGSVPARPRFDRTLEEYDALARDPATGNRITPATQAERDVGLGLEERGAVPGPIRRDTSGNAEFIDADGVEWDVKSYRSDYPNGFVPERVERQLTLARDLGENIMLDTRSLSPDDLSTLREIVARNGFEDVVLYYP